jgi:1-acyl-sn-glycerol-3-phosphate acyltransferase
MTRGDRVYRIAQWIPRTVWRTLAGIEVAGRHHIPATGPFLLICNHQSNLDPILIQSVCPRPVHAMAKSTQFATPVVRSVMKRLYSFPVRRYQPDPQAVRIVLRRLAAGHGVAIYIEGERSWDGRLQPPKLGTARLVLKTGVPVVPCTITGSYEAWPRWHHRIQLLPIRVTFGEPLRFPRLDHRRDREPAVLETAARIMEALEAQITEVG